MPHPKETATSLLEYNRQSPITNHPLSRHIFERTPLIILSNNDLKEILENGNAEETLDETLRNPKHFNGFCAFLAREYSLYYELMIRLDKLQHTIFIMDFFPESTEKNFLPITQAEFLEDTMELYIINTSALQDRLFEFVNFIYDLKVPVNALDKKEQIIDKIGNVVLKNELEKLDQAFSDVRKARNTVVHSGSFYDEALENIFQLEIRYRERRQNGEEIKNFDETKQIDGLYGKYIHEEKSNIYLNDMLITKLLVRVLDSLYRQHKSILAENKQFVSKYTKLRDGKKNNNTIRENTTLFKSARLEELTDAVLESKDK